ncbi:MAG: cardiolipin synthase [Planctomycetes bacterium]|nr:cardiolipin synthase [Planctomycetota bacterium]
MSFAAGDSSAAELTIWGLSVTALFFYLLTLLLIRYVLLLKKRNPASTVAWILAIIMLPLMGGLLFLVFGINRVKRRRTERERARQKSSASALRLSQYHVILGDVLNEQQQRLMRLARRVAGTTATGGNQIEVLVDTNRTLGLIEQSIGAAEESLHLEYYIWQPDRTGSRIRDLLIEKAKEGIAVRFLYDKIGSMRLGRKFLKPMRAAGIQVASFLPGTTLRERWSVNLRSHRKILIVDGKFGFTGGMNIGDEYVGKNPRLGFWRDTHLRMTGPTVLQLQQVFAEDWFFATGEQLDHATYFSSPAETGKTIAQVIAGEPAGDVDTFYALMFAAINEARQRVTLATSYFIPPISLMTALESAAYRGVKVRLLVTGRSEHFWTLLAARSYYDSLLAAGVEIFEYNRGLLHSKTLTIDGNWSLIGTPNFDARSLLLNFEVGVVMYDFGIAVQLEEQFQNDLKWSDRITAEDRQRLSAWKVLGENVCRLFAPVL